MNLRTYDVVHEEGAHPIKMWTRGVEVGENTLNQLQNIAKMPFIHSHVAAMPDVHLGIGATVGSVIATDSAIIPAAVGVDIGCGMMAVRLPLYAKDLPDNLSNLRSAIEASVPHGRTNNGGPGDRGAWNEVPHDIGAEWKTKLETDYERIISKHPGAKSKNTANHLGSLGTGNHFIELCLDEEGRVWMMLHSGSRGVGNRIGSYFIELAKKDMKIWHINLPDQDLAYLPDGTENFSDYIEAVEWAQKYADINRKAMMQRALLATYKTLGIEPSIQLTALADESIVSCHHNYVQREHHFRKNVWVTRKGAVSARQGQLGIIPGSMGAKSFIVRGKGNHESFHSCSHGAGRKMSRTEAKKTFTIEEHKAAVRGVECRVDEDVIDETPAAYKDIDAVMAAQSDLVEVVHTLKQVLCVKG